MMQIMYTIAQMRQLEVKILHLICKLIYTVFLKLNWKISCFSKFVFIKKKAIKQPRHLYQVPFPKHFIAITVKSLVVCRSQLYLVDLLKNKIIVLFPPCFVIYVVFTMQLSDLPCRSWVQFHPRSKWQTINMWYVIQYYDQGYWCHKGKFLFNNMRFWLQLTNLCISYNYLDFGPLPIRE